MAERQGLALTVVRWAARAIGIPPTGMVLFFLASHASAEEGMQLASAADFVAIGVLSIALAVSVYLNVTDRPEPVEEVKLLSVLIADFDNQTGQSMFDGLLEQALNVGIESAPHITAYQRNDARGLADRLQPGHSGLDAAVSRLIAVREGIDLILTGSIEADG